MEDLLAQFLPNVVKLFPDLIEALTQTLITVAVSFTFSFSFGLPLGVILVVTREDDLLPAVTVNRILSYIIDIFRSMPTLILITAITPFTKLVMGTKIGIKGAIVPLVVASVPFLARQVEAALSKVDKGIVEAAKSMGTNTFLIIVKVILPESVGGLVHALTITFVSLISFSAIAGAVGGGGLGDFALRFGYQRFQTDVMLVTVLILVVLVMSVQALGKRIVKKIQH